MNWRWLLILIVLIVIVLVGYILIYKPFNKTADIGINQIVAQDIALNTLNRSGQVVSMKNLYNNTFNSTLYYSGKVYYYNVTLLSTRNGSGYACVQSVRTNEGILLNKSLVEWMYNITNNENYSLTGYDNGEFSVFATMPFCLGYGK